MQSYYLESRYSQHCTYCFLSGSIRIMKLSLGVVRISYYDLKIIFI